MKNTLAFLIVLFVSFSTLAQKIGVQVSSVGNYPITNGDVQLWYNLGNDEKGSYVINKADASYQQVEIDVLNTDKTLHKRLAIKFFKNKKGLANDTLFAQHGKIYAVFRELTSVGLKSRLIAVYDRDGNMLQEKEIVFDDYINYFFISVKSDTVRALAFYLMPNKKKNAYLNHYTSNLELIDSMHLALKPSGRILALKQYKDVALAMIENTCCKIDLNTGNILYSETEIIQDCTFSYLGFTVSDSAYFLTCLYTFESSEKKGFLNHEGFVSCRFNPSDLKITYQHKHPFSEQAKKLAFGKNYQFLKGIDRLSSYKSFVKPNGNLVLASTRYEINGATDGAMLMEISNTGEIVWNTFLIYKSTTNLKPIFMLDDNTMHIIVPEHAKNIKFQNLIELHEVEPVTNTTTQALVNYSVNETGRIKQNNLYTKSETDIFDAKATTTWTENGQVFLLLAKSKNAYQRLSFYPEKMSSRITF